MTAVAGSPTPVLSWSAPTAGLSPTRYYVYLYELTPTSAPLRHSAITAEHSIKVLPGFLQRGRSYIMLVSAMAESPAVSDAQPFETPRWYETAPAVSEIWRVSP